MFRRLGLLFAGTLAVLVGDSVAEAQFVRVSPFGGVRVRAPFVSVDVLPYGGGTRVRAPFTSVNTGLYGYRGYRYGFYDYGLPPGINSYRSHYPPRRRYGGSVYTAPLVPDPVYVPRSSPSIVYPESIERPSIAPRSEDPSPTPSYEVAPAYEVARPLSADVAERLRRAAMRLQQHYAQQQDGDVWLNYLQPQLIVDAIDRGTNPESLKSLLANYNGVMANPSLRDVRRASGFTETRVLLERYIDQAQASEGVSNEPAADDGSAAEAEEEAMNNEPVEDNPPPPPQPDVEELPPPAASEEAVSL